MSAYTEGEVVWLLGMDEEQARGYDDGCRSALQSVHAGGGDERPVPVGVRWHEVRDAIERLHESVGELAVAAAMMVGSGASHLETGDALGVSRQTVGRQVRAAARAVVELLGGERVDVAPALFRQAMCLRCGRRPRVRAAARRMRVAGRRVVVPERQLAVCARCASRSVRLVTDRPAA